MKTNNFRGDLTGISAKKEALLLLFHVHVVHKAVDLNTSARRCVACSFCVKLCGASLSIYGYSLCCGCSSIARMMNPRFMLIVYHTGGLTVTRSSVYQPISGFCLVRCRARALHLSVCSLYHIYAVVHTTSVTSVLLLHAEVRTTFLLRLFIPARVRLRTSSRLDVLSRT